MNKSLVTAVAAAALALGIPGLAGAKDKDKETCGPYMLTGEYLLSATGFTRTTPGDAWVPKAILELLQFHADGNVVTPAVTVVNTANNNGAVLEAVPGSTGTYTFDQAVDGACLFTITFSDGPAWRLYVPLEADEIWMVQTKGRLGVQYVNVLEGKAKRIR